MRRFRTLAAGAFGALLFASLFLVQPAVAEHEEADGLVLRQGGVDIVTVWQGVVTGQLSLQPGNWTQPFDVILLDPEGGEFQPDEPAYSLGWSLGDPLVAGLEATADWAFRLEGLATGTTGLVLSVMHEGHADFSSPAIPVVSSPTSSVGGQPLVVRLAVANAPNPFNPSTTISFRLAEAGATTVSVHDVAGRLVRTLLASEERAAGEHAVIWDGRDADGRPVESGIYLCRVESGSSRELRKMTLLK